MWQQPTDGLQTFCGAPLVSSEEGQAAPHSSTSVLCLVYHDDNGCGGDDDDGGDCCCCCRLKNCDDADVTRPLQVSTSSSVKRLMASDSQTS